MPAYKDLSGKQVGNWLVLYQFGRTHDGKILWKCRCLLCKNTVKEYTAFSMKKVHNCGCVVEDRFVGKVYGKLLIIKKFRKCKCSGTKHYICKCMCGKYVLKNRSDILSGHTRSCGCLRKEVSTKTHGMSDHPLYDTYRSMIRRCTIQNKHRNRTYIERKISITESWLGEYGVIKFIEFISNKHPNFIDLLEQGYSLNRKDNDGDYTEENCELADKYVQANNKSNNRIEKAFGVTSSLASLVRRFGHHSLNYSIIRNRCSSGWNTERALTEPHHQTAYYVNDQFYNNKKSLIKLFKQSEKVFQLRINEGWNLLEALVMSKKYKRLTLDELKDVLSR